MMKKRFAFALAVMMILMSLAGCGDKNGKQDSSVSEESSSTGSTSIDPSPDVSASGSVSQDPTQSTAPDESTPAESQQPGENNEATTPPAANTPDNNGAAQKPKPQQPAPSQPKPQQPAKAPAVTDVASAVEKALAEDIDFMSLTADDMATVYGVSASAMDGFVCKMPQINVKATEYMVAKAAAGQAETVKAAAVKRQADLDATWKRYLPDQYELVKNYKLVVNGDYVLFVVGENAQAAVDAFDSMTK